MKTTAEKIIAYARRQPEGAPLQAKALLHLGSRSAVDQALSRLHRSQDLVRISRGVYARPVEGRFGTRPPAPAKVVEAISQVTGEVIASHGAAAANTLGLSTQVPVRPTYLTSGPTRQIKVGSQVLQLRHAPPWQLLLPGRPAGEAVRALAWLGPKEARRTMRTLRRRLPRTELSALVEARARFPTWLAQEMSGLVAHA
jgi:hypothetical protein